MMDTYLKSTNREALAELKSFAMNVIGPVQGVNQDVDDDGNSIPAKGDARYWYVCVRFLLPIQPFGDIEACDVAEGQAVCGIWA